MMREQWIETVKWISANWPHTEIPDATIAVWWESVGDLEAEKVHAALLTMASREFPPSGAQVRDVVFELDRDDPDLGVAWQLVQKAIVKYGLHHEHRQADALAWLEERSPVVAEAVRRFGPDSLGSYSYDDEGTVRAQFREIYRGVVRDASESARFAGLPSGGLRRLERAGPRRINVDLVLQPGPDELLDSSDKSHKG